MFQSSLDNSATKDGGYNDSDDGQGSWNDKIRKGKSDYELKVLPNGNSFLDGSRYLFHEDGFMELRNSKECLSRVYFPSDDSGDRSNAVGLFCCKVGRGIAGGFLVLPSKSVGNGVPTSKSDY